MESDVIGGSLSYLYIAGVGNVSDVSQLLNHSMNLSLQLVNSNIWDGGGNQECGPVSASEDRRIERLLRTSNMLLLIYPWVFMCTGTLTNSISFAVLTRPKLKKSSTFFYLACLCIIDLLSLYTFCINFVFFYHFKVLKI